MLILVVEQLCLHRTTATTFTRGRRRGTTVSPCLHLSPSFSRMFPPFRVRGPFIIFLFLELQAVTSHHRSQLQDADPSTKSNLSFYTNLKSRGRHAWTTSSIFQIYKLGCQLQIYHAVETKASISSFSFLWWTQRTIK